MTKKASEYCKAVNETARMIDKMAGERLVVVSCYGGKVEAKVGRKYVLRGTWRDVYYQLLGVAKATGYPIHKVCAYVDSSDG